MFYLFLKSSLKVDKFSIKIEEKEKSIANNWQDFFGFLAILLYNYWIVVLLYREYFPSIANTSNKKYWQYFGNTLAVLPILLPILLYCQYYQSPLSAWHHLWTTPNSINIIQGLMTILWNTMWWSSKLFGNSSHNCTFRPAAGQLQQLLWAQAVLIANSSKDDFPISIYPISKLNQWVGLWQ